MNEIPPVNSTRQTVAVQGRSARGRVTGKLKTAIERMVWHGDKRADAALAAGLSAHGLYSAMRKPWVKAAYLAECEALRVSGRARRIHRLEALSEQDENKQAAVNAARALDYMGEDAAAAAGTGEPRVAGIVIVVHNNPAPAPIHHDPMPAITINEIEPTPAPATEFAPSRRLAPPGMAPAKRDPFIDG